MSMRESKPAVAALVLCCIGDDCAGNTRSEPVGIVWVWDPEVEQWTWELAKPVPEGWDDLADDDENTLGYFDGDEVAEVNGYCPTCSKTIHGIELPKNLS